MERISRIRPEVLGRGVAFLRGVEYDTPDRTHETLAGCRLPSDGDRAGHQAGSALTLLATPHHTKTAPHLCRAPTARKNTPPPEESEGVVVRGLAYTDADEGVNFGSARPRPRAARVNAPSQARGAQFRRNRAASTQRPAFSKARLSMGWIPARASPEQFWLS
jgi:hypothetical protein